MEETNDYIQLAAAETIDYQSLDGEESSEQEQMDQDSLKRYNELVSRLRSVERQHLNDKASWKLKLESVLADARQECSRKEEWIYQYETLNLKHEEALRSHRQEKKRLEQNSQEAEREIKKSMTQVQRELKLKIAELTAEIKMLQANAKEKRLKYRTELQDQTAKFKTEKDDLLARLSAQRSQIVQLKEGNKKAVELCEQLSQKQQKHTKEQRHAQSAQQTNELEIAFLREELDSFRKKEKELVSSSQGEIVSLRGKLDASQKREEAVGESIVALENKLREQAVVTQTQDKEIDAWTSTAEKLEDCLLGVVELESRSTESLQEHICCLIASLQKHFDESADGREQLAVESAKLRDKVGAWKRQVAELEATLARAKKPSTKDQKTVEELQATIKDQEVLIQKKQGEIVEWEANYTKIEQCVEDLMKLENETSEGYEERMNFLILKNRQLEKQVQTMTRKNRELSYENAGLHVDGELGLEAIFSSCSPTKRVSTPTTEDEDSTEPLSPRNKDS